MPDIPIYNKCNNRCIICSNPDDYKDMPEGYFTLPFLSGKLKKFYEGEGVFLNNYRDAFQITGGEPTLSPCLFAVIKKIGVLFPKAKAVILTNGRMLHYKGYAKELLKLNGRLELAVALHAHQPQIHDMITRAPGSFYQTVSGLKNVFKFKSKRQAVELRVVIHGKNYRLIDKLIEFIYAEFPQVDRLVLIFFEVEGVARDNIGEVGLSYTGVRPYIAEVGGSLNLFREVRFYHFPLCMVPRRFFPYVWRTLPAAEVVFPGACGRCSLKKFCLGLHKGYLEHFGVTELRPEKKRPLFEEGPNWHHPIIRIATE